MIEAKQDGVTGPWIDSIERLQSMTEQEVDDLPYGFIVLDGHGEILLYNRYESRMSRLPVERVVGRNFFRDVAPCTRVEAFHGRFRALVEDPSRSGDRFAFRFHFLHGAQDVSVQLTRVSDGATASGSALAAARVFMVVERRIVDEVARSAAGTFALDPDRGRVVGALGPVLPLSVEALVTALSSLGPSGAREVGRALGAAIAACASRDAARFGAADLARAPAQLAAGALDEAMMNAGLGRLAFDQTAREETHVIGCLVRPAIACPDPLLAVLYEGLLEAALGAALGSTFAARCLDERELLATPWRFALASHAAAADLEAKPGELANDVARRLGLLVEDANLP